MSQIYKLFFNGKRKMSVIFTFLYQSAYFWFPAVLPFYINDYSCWLHILRKETARPLFWLICYPAALSSLDGN